MILLGVFVFNKDSLNSQGLFHALILYVLGLLNPPLNELLGCHLLAKVKVVGESVISKLLSHGFQLCILLLLFLLGALLVLGK